MQPPCIHLHGWLWWWWIDGGSLQLLPREERGREGRGRWLLAAGCWPLIQAAAGTAQAVISAAGGSPSTEARHRTPGALACDESGWLSQRCTSSHFAHTGHPSMEQKPNLNSEPERRHQLHGSPGQRPRDDPGSPGPSRKRWPPLLFLLPRSRKRRHRRLEHQQNATVQRALRCMNSRWCL